MRMYPVKRPHSIYFRLKSVIGSMGETLVNPNAIECTKNGLIGRFEDKAYNFLHNCIYFA